MFLFVAPVSSSFIIFSATKIKSNYNFYTQTKWKTVFTTPYLQCKNKKTNSHLQNNTKMATSVDETDTAVQVVVSDLTGIKTIKCI